MAVKQTKSAKKFAQKGRSNLQQIVKKRKLQQVIKKSKQYKPTQDELKQHDTNQQEQTDSGNKATIYHKSINELTVDELLNDNYFDDTIDNTIQSDTDVGLTTDDEEGDGIGELDNMDDETLENDIKLHQQQLDQLKDTDPEFYSHLQKQENHLLNIPDHVENDDSDELGSDEEAESDVEQVDTTPRQQKSNNNLKKLMDKLNETYFHKLRTLILTRKSIPPPQRILAVKQLIKLIKSVVVWIF